MDVRMVLQPPVVVRTEIVKRDMELCCLNQLRTRHQVSDYFESPPKNLMFDDHNGIR